MIHIHIFKTLHPPVHLRQKSFHPLYPGCPNNSLLHLLQQTKKKQPHYAFERTKSKQKQNQVTLHSNWPRVLLFDLAHKQCNGIINTDLGGLFIISFWGKGSFKCMVRLFFLGLVERARGGGFVWTSRVKGWKDFGRRWTGVEESWKCVCVSLCIVLKHSLELS